MQSITLFNFVRRLYYVSKRFIDNAKKFGYTVFQYYKRLLSYYSKLELSRLKQMYEFQSECSKYDCDSLVLMYPEFCYQNYGKDETFSYFKDMFHPLDLFLISKELESFSYKNKSRG